MTYYNPDICFYHSPCADGFAAAYAIWTKWPEIEFIGVNHGEPIDLENVKGKNVLFVDFSLKAPAIREMSQVAETIVILDHHKSAQKELEEFIEFDGSIEGLDTAHSYAWYDKTGDKVFVHFDMDHSGAVLAWKFARPDTNIPWAFKYIEDRDLWNWNYPESKPFGLALSCLPKGDFVNEFYQWEQEVVPTYKTDELITKGQAIESYQQALIEQLASHAYLADLVNNDGQEWTNVVMCNSGVLQSELGNYLINKYPEAPFAAIWYEVDGNFKWSLRSEDSRTDVSQVASAFGGGGHRNSAGFNY